MLSYAGVTTFPKRPRFELPYPVGESTPLDWSGRLSLEMIRQHTKTDDVPGVTDAQLELYRAAAIEAAELYTGLLLSCQRSVTEPIEGPAHPRPGHVTYKHMLRYPSADGLVHLYGGDNPNDNVGFLVAPGSRTIKVPIKTGYIDTTNCCDPCSSHHMNGGMMVVYKAGFASADAVPAGIVLGCLQYLAWVIEHPGDEIVTQRNRVDARAGGSSGSNNIALASGALETWRNFDPEAI